MGLNYRIKCVLNTRNGLLITANKGGGTPAALNASRPLRSHPPSNEWLAAPLFRVLTYSDLTNPPSDCLLRSGFRSPSNILLGEVLGIASLGSLRLHVFY